MNHFYCKINESYKLLTNSIWNKFLAQFFAKFTSCDILGIFHGRFSLMSLFVLMAYCLHLSWMIKEDLSTVILKAVLPVFDRHIIHSSWWKFEIFGTVDWSLHNGSFVLELFWRSFPNIYRIKSNMISYHHIMPLSRPHRLSFHINSCKEVIFWSNSNQNEDLCFLRDFDEYGERRLRGERRPDCVSKANRWDLKSICHFCSEMSALDGAPVCHGSLILVSCLPLLL